MSAADDLREAAKLLRERAQAATPGPWEHVNCDANGSYMGCGEVETWGDGVEGGQVAGPTGDLYPRSGYSPRDDMAYIASMHPLVGLALAEVFELEEQHVLACRLGEQHAGAEPGLLTGKREEAVHRLARLYLGRSS